MVSIKGLTKLSVITFFGVQFFIETIAYPIVEEKNQGDKKLEPRIQGSSGQSSKTKPLLGGALLGGGAVLAYRHFTKGRDNGNIVMPSQPLASDNGGPTGDPFLSNTGSNVGSIPTTDSSDLATDGLDTATGKGAGTAAAAGAAGTGVGTDTALVKKDVLERSEYGALEARKFSVGKSSALKSGLGTVGTIVGGAAVLNLFSGIVNGRKNRKEEQAKAIEETGGEPEETSSKKSESKPESKSKSKSKSESEKSESKAGSEEDEEQTE